tara:strand:+ start:466 stop:5112 length:4647 start_codon:yes stop_codon:yes gene_type:complete
MADYLDREEQAYDQLLASDKEQKLSELRTPEAANVDTETGIIEGEKAGPTLEASEAEQTYAEYQDDPNIEVIDGKSYYKRGDRNAADVGMDYTGEAVGRMTAVGQGVLDTSMDAIGAVASVVPWLKPLGGIDEAYDANLGRNTETDPVKKIIRDIAATVVPTLAFGGVVAGGLKQAASGVMLSNRTHLIGRIAAEAGIGTAVTAVSDQTDEAENLATLMYDLTGVNVPWRHVDGDSPYWTFAKNMVEDSFFNIAGGALEAYTALKSTTKHIPLNETSSQYLQQKIEPIQQARDELQDPVAAAVQVKDDLRADAVSQETAERMARRPKSEMQITDTRGQGQYFHGSSEEFEFVEGGEFSGAQNIYGNGLYVTDDIQTAQSYTAKNKKQSGENYKPSIYNVSPNFARENFYNLDQPVDQDVLNSLLSYIKNSNNDAMVDLLYDVRLNQQSSLADIMDTIRTNSGHDAFQIPDYEVLEFFDEIIKQPLIEKGFKGFIHQGGKKAGKGKRTHEVAIIWDPANNAKLNPANIDDFSTPINPPDYDPFINEPHLPSERSVKNYDANIVDFKTDVARIANNIGADEAAGRARPAITPGMMKLVGQGDEVREQALKEFGETLDAINVDTMIGEDLITSAMKEDAINDLVDKAANLGGMDFAKAVESLREAVENVRGNTIQYLGADNAELGQNALNRMMDVLDPKSLKGSAVVAYQAGKDIADSAAAINLGNTSNWTARQQEQIIQNIPILMQEVRAHQYIKGYTLKMLDMVKRAKQDGIYNVDWINQKNQEFTMQLRATREKALEFTNLMYDISQENPEYFKPLYQQFLRSEGKVDTIYKLNKLMQERMGLWGKAFGLGNKKMPSLLIKELGSVIYNSVLYGFAPIRAGSDAVLHTVIKPATILGGYASQGKFGEMKRALYGFGGFTDNFQRAMKHAADEWRFSVQHPDFAGSRARNDFKPGALQDYDTMELMMDAWAADKTPGNVGKLVTAQAIKSLSWWNRYTPENKIARHFGPRSGVSALSYVDGFTKSLQASFVARTKAYDEVFSRTNGAMDQDLFDAAQERLYNSMFSKDGVLTDTAASYAAAEINLNLDNDMVSFVEKMVNDYPIAKALFLFPRTGMNELSRLTTFNPLGPLGLSMGKARKAIKAKTNEEIADVLRAHGYRETDRAAFETIRAEYIGRQNMSSLVVTGIGMAAMFGNITGSGPANHAERRRWQDLGGFKPYSIKVGENEDGSPIWVSYKGTGIFETLLGMTSDIVFNANKVDRDADQWFTALAGAIGMNITNKSFLSGFEPLVAALSGDKGSLNRFLSNNANSLLPYSGARNILSRTIEPQLKDVENNFLAYMANKNRFLPGVGDKLVNSVDIYTGEPINYTTPILNHLNGMLPFGHVNAHMEPWRQRLLESGWDGKKTLLMNPDTKQQYTPAQRQWINNYIGKKGQLGREVQQLFSMNDGAWKRTIETYKKQRPGLVKEILGQGFSQKNYPWKKTILMEYLDRMHNRAYQEAIDALKASDTDLGRAVILQNIIEGNIQQDNFEGAASAVKQLQQFNSTK